MKSQQVLTESEVFEDEVFPGTKSADHPAEEMPERHDHGKNVIGIVRIELFAKSFILWVYDVLARHSIVIATNSSLGIVLHDRLPFRTRGGQRRSLTKLSAIRITALLSITGPRSLL